MVKSVLSHDALIHLKSYKYSSVDKSYISRYILKHYWNAFVNVLPLWLAPNTVTLLGFFFILGNVGLLAIYVPDLVGPGPQWIYFSFAFGLWMYSTMDNVDGKQARRTGTSSGLGELFDHGIDSLNCTLGSLLETAAMGYGPGTAGTFTALVPCLPMFFSTWETYHTHTLYLGYFNGPTEGLILACSIMIMSGIYGPQIWHSRIADVLGYADFFGEYTIRDCWVPLLLFSFFAAHMPDCIYNVVTARRKSGLPIAPVFLEWTPMVIYTLGIGAWVYSPHSTLLQENHLMLVCLTLSLVFGRMTTKIILAHLTRQPFPYFTAMLVPLLAGALLFNLPVLGLKPITLLGLSRETTEYYYLWAFFLYANVVYFRWAYLVIRDICDFLDINCLTIKQQPVARAKEGKKKAPGTLEVEKRIADGGKKVK
ncbi:Choline/ethanolaminephosphotransferase [Viridothelium virens]|uniref:Choline/ethanolaminephosphotransferase n=1 Tax=Viridothelium virens TaxID=1048519 RepID=A0A6A6H9F5_VIRVR|nr:Choline/ethanolaminephosphotransferase [Viridothelium virens]